MTLNEFLKKGQKISWLLTSGDIPLTLNGEPIEIYDITLEGENGNYWADIKAISKPKEEKKKDPCIGCYYALRGECAIEIKGHCIHK